MSDQYRIEIRCDHVTPAGARKQPIVATALWFDDADMWEYLGTERRTANESAPRNLDDARERQHAMHTDDRRSSVERQSGSDRELYGDGPSEDRVRIACTAPWCRRSVARLRSSLDPQMDKVRHAGLHQVPLSML